MEKATSVVRPQVAVTPQHPSKVPGTNAVPDGHLGQPTDQGTDGLIAARQPFQGGAWEGFFLERVYAHTRRLGGCQGASLAGDGLACRERQPDPPQAGLAGFRADANTAACDGMNEPPHLAETTRWRARAHMTPTRVATWQPAQRAAARRIRPMALLPRRSPGLPLPDRTSAKLADGQRCQSSIGARVPEPGRTGGDRRLPPGPCRHGYGAYPGVSPSPARGSGGNRRVRSGAVVCRARQPIPGR